MGLYDFAPISDGATALVLTRSDLAESYTNKPVYIRGYSSATDYITFPSRNDLTGFVATRLAMEDVIKTADIKRQDISMLQVYDQSTMMGMVSLEDLGFCTKGKAWIETSNTSNENDGAYELGGLRLFVNLNGGLKADGNPLGATGGAQIFEIFKQLRDEAGERQVENGGELKYGCTLELEGFGTKGYVYILGSD